MEILPISELGLALHNFVNKDDKAAFLSCLQTNLEDTQVLNIAMLVHTFLKSEFQTWSLLVNHGNN